MLFGTPPISISSCAPQPSDYLEANPSSNFPTSALTAGHRTPNFAIDIDHYRIRLTSIHGELQLDIASPCQTARDRDVALIQSRVFQLIKPTNVSVNPKNRRAILLWLFIRTSSIVQRQHLMLAGKPCYFGSDASSGNEIFRLSLKNDVE